MFCLKKAKNKKLLIEVGIITIIMFAATLVYTSLSSYFVTRESFLNSKNEMIDRDLKNISTNINDLASTKWYWKYIKENSDDMKRDMTEEEAALSISDEIINEKLGFLTGERDDYETCDPQLQFFLAKAFFQSIAINTDHNVRELDYTEISLLEFLGDNKAYLYLQCDESEPDPMSAENLESNEFVKSYVDCLNTIDYDETEHTAVKKILDGDIAEAGKTIYEVYTDPETDKDYYIGYTPVVINGEVMCYLSIKYDWSDFHSELLGKVRNSILRGFAVLVVLNILLMLFIYLMAISPLSKVKEGVMEYMNDKDSRKAEENMSSIKVRNEIGVLADSFSELATEIDRYTEENLRLGAEKEHIATELSLATNIQTGSLPSKFPAFPDRKEFDIFASMDPAKEVGGDFYDFFMIDDDHLAMVIADVSGKGVPAALFMMSSKILINDHAIMGGNPGEILDRVNKQVFAMNKANMFVTVWLGILEISTGKLTSASAGHEYPMININGRYELLKDKHGMPVGAMKMSKYHTKLCEIQLKKGDSIFVYTDGVAEATNANNELFGTERTLDALNAIPKDAAQQDVLKGVRAAVDAFVKEAPQFDDLTMLGLRYFGPEGNEDKEEDSNKE